MKQKRMRDSHRQANRQAEINAKISVYIIDLVQKVSANKKCSGKSSIKVY